MTLKDKVAKNYSLYKNEKKLSVKIYMLLTGIKALWYPEGGNMTSSI